MGLGGGNSQQQKDSMMEVIKQQLSKESLYNELLTSFDFSLRKHDSNSKHMDPIKKNINQTQSTMSLFSNNIPVN